MKGPVTFDQRALLLAHQGNPEVRKHSDCSGPDARCVAIGPHSLLTRQDSSPVLVPSALASESGRPAPPAPHPPEGQEAARLPSLRPTSVPEVHRLTPTAAPQPRLLQQGQDGRVGPSSSGRLSRMSKGWVLEFLTLPELDLGGEVSWRRQGVDTERGGGMSCSWTGLGRGWLADPGLWVGSMGGSSQRGEQSL